MNIPRFSIPKFNVPESISIPTDGAVCVGTGAAAGFGIEATIGGAGLAAMGSAIAIPMALTGAGLGLAFYVAYRIGKAR